MCYCSSNLLKCYICSYDWWVFNKSIHLIQNPLIISHVTRIRDIILPKPTVEIVLSGTCTFKTMRTLNVSFSCATCTVCFIVHDLGRIAPNSPRWGTIKHFQFLDILNKLFYEIKDCYSYDQRKKTVVCPRLIHHIRYSPCIIVGLKHSNFFLRLRIQTKKSYVTAVKSCRPMHKYV
jgi:hypothetical protein